MNCDELLSRFSFNLNLRPYTKGLTLHKYQQEGVQWLLNKLKNKVGRCTLKPFHNCSTTVPQPFHNRSTTVPQPFHNRSITVPATVPHS